MRRQILRQDAILRDDEIGRYTDVVGPYIVVAAEIAYGIEIIVGHLTTDVFHYI